MNGMIQLVGYMVAAYGIARLIITISKSENAKQVVGVLGCIALALLAALLTNQAETVANIGNGFGI